jgi:hypothetical protein
MLLPPIRPEVHRRQRIPGKRLRLKEQPIARLITKVCKISAIKIRLVPRYSGEFCEDAELDIILALRYAELTAETAFTPFVRRNK